MFFVGWAKRSVPTIYHCAQNGGHGASAPLPPYEASPSLRLQPRRLDHLRPLLGLFRDQFTEFGRRARQRFAADRGETGFHTGIGDRGIDLLVELIDDCSWRLARRA